MKATDIRNAALIAALVAAIAAMILAAVLQVKHLPADVPEELMPPGECSTLDR